MKMKYCTAWFLAVLLAVGSVPARASIERVEGVPPSKRGQDARDTVA